MTAIPAPRPSSSGAAHMKWVTKPRAAALAGLTVQQLEARRENGTWREGVHWVKAPDARVLFSPEAIEEWASAQAVAGDRPKTEMPTYIGMADPMRRAPRPMRIPAGAGSGVRAASSSSIEISFELDGVRCREKIKLPPTAVNLRLARNKKSAIVDEIAAATFDYATHFPNSKLAQRMADAPAAPL
jgi:Arm domain-containing DNA-binding protein